MNRFRQCDGFTLIEVVVSLAIFSMLAALSYATFNRIVEGTGQITQQMTRLQQVQRTVALLTNDFAQLAPRPIRDELGGGDRPALLADARNEYLVEFTRGGLVNPLGLQRSTQQRIAYRVDDDKLIRLYWPVLDRTLATEPLDAELIDDVESFRVRYFVPPDRWSEEWPAGGATTGRAAYSRPRAVEFVLELRDWGEIRRVVEVAD
jgi:general secretion pathway protein J